MVGLSSSRSSPGASSLAVGLGWAFARRSLSALVLEADIAGGVLGQRLALTPQPSLLTLVRDAEEVLSEEVLARHVVEHRDVHYLLAPVDPAVATTSVEQLGRLLATSNFRPSVPTLADLGRWSSAGQWRQMARAMDHLLLVTSPRLEDVQSTRFALSQCGQLNISVGLVVVGDTPFSPAEVSESIGAPLAGAIVHDPTTAAALRGGAFSAGAYHRSLLGRSIDALASTVLGAAR